MALSDLYNKVVDTERMATVSGTNKKTFAANLSDVDCTIHPVESQQQNLNDGAFYETFKMWCPVDTDIQTGDRVLDGADVYTVRGVSVYDFGRSNHLRVTLARGK